MPEQKAILFVGEYYGLAFGTLLISIIFSPSETIMELDL